MKNIFLLILAFFINPIWAQDYKSDPIYIKLSEDAKVINPKHVGCSNKNKLYNFKIEYNEKVDIQPPNDHEFNICDIVESDQDNYFIIFKIKIFSNSETKNGTIKYNTKSNSIQSVEVGKFKVAVGIEQDIRRILINGIGSKLDLGFKYKNPTDFKENLATLNEFSQCEYQSSKEQFPFFYSCPAMWEK